MYVRGEFRDVGKLPLLAGGPGRGDAVKGSDERLVIGEDAETAAFKEKAEVTNGGEDSEELLIKGGVPCLSGGEFVAEEGKRLPAAVRELLKNTGDMSVRGIRGEGKGGSRVRVHEGNGGGKGGLSVEEGGGAGWGPGEGLGRTSESIREGLEDTGGMRNETAVEIHETEETLEILD